MPVKDPSPRRPSEDAPRRPRGQDVVNDTDSSVPADNTVDRGRSRVRGPSNAEHDMQRKGYHSLHSSFGKVFHVKKRWKLIREMGSGAYGVVISAGDEITGETVAIKLVSRVFDKIQLAKRALREITLLRHFTGHANITGLIDAKMISPESNEIYIFMEPMEADLHQIIKSGQTLTSEHVQYFVYQILRGLKFVHSASVIHRDLKPGNLLVNADCELKICDFGLSRGFENASHLTEYVATRWYRAPEIMLGFREYDTAIDVWSVGCILAELLSSQPLFKGKDYVDQLKKILDVLGSPEETVLQKIASEKARTYVRSLPISKKRPFTKILPTADIQAIELLSHMLTFDPDQRFTVTEALEHPWLSGYHEPEEEPECSEVFEKWKAIEELETLDEFRVALWNEIQDYRREIRGGVDDEDDFIAAEVPEEPSPMEVEPVATEELTAPTDVVVVEEEEVGGAELSADDDMKTEPEGPKTEPVDPAPESLAPPAPPAIEKQLPATPTDPVVTYGVQRRSSIMQPTRQGSIYGSPRPSSQHLHSFTESPLPSANDHPPGGIAFPTQFPTQGYVFPARSRTGSTAGRGEVTRKLLRTLSTVSIHESAEGRAGGLAEIAPIGRFIVESTSEADAPASEMPRILEDEERKPGAKKEGGAFFI
ncbi:Pkinase-domain-containing protein [Mycena metata]|uniref:mitogen-activated protein kinase n=1 Tax=Mycena metata TaxID=1033252 RepID=A0AAD7NGU0_9AGAR|nr:Pkinase-domain-containing protein [Mycena metata]